jgi:hypothetical protein
MVVELSFISVGVPLTILLQVIVLGLPTWSFIDIEGAPSETELLFTE